MRDSERVEVRSRLVAREIKQKGTDSYFAGTPPLALVRYVISKAATLSKSGKRRQLMALDAKRQAARPQTSPGGAKPSAPLDHEELEPDGQQAYHSVSARLAYLASDRPDIAFACKECSRAVGKATRADLTRLKRIGRYPLHIPRAKKRAS